MNFAKAFILMKLLLYRYVYLIVYTFYLHMDYTCMSNTIQVSE
jgi:hypothetical protein